MGTTRARGTSTRGLLVRRLQSLVEQRQCACGRFFELRSRFGAFTRSKTHATLLLLLHSPKTASHSSSEDDEEHGPQDQHQHPHPHHQQQQQQQQQQQRKERKGGADSDHQERPAKRSRPHQQQQNQQQHQLTVADLRQLPPPAHAAVAASEGARRRARVGAATTAEAHGESCVLHAYDAWGQQLKR